MDFRELRSGKRIQYVPRVRKAAKDSVNNPKKVPQKKKTEDRKPLVKTALPSENVDIFSKLPDDLTRQILSGCRLPTLNSVSRTSKYFKETVQRFFELEGHSQTIWQRERYAYEQKPRASKDIQYEIVQHAMRSSAYKRDNNLERLIKSLSAALAKKTVTRLGLPDKLAPEHWPEVIKTLTQKRDWESLKLDFRHIRKNEFVHYAQPAMLAIQPSKKIGTLIFECQTDFSAVDAEAMIYCLKKVSRHTIFELPSIEKSLLPGFEEIWSNLSSIGVDRMKLSFVTGIDARMQGIVMNGLIGNPTLEHLEIEFPCPTSFDSQFPHNILVSCPKLKTLHLSDNHLHMAGAKTFANVLAAHPTLERINFCNKRLPKEGWQLIAEALGKNSRITHITVNIDSDNLDRRVCTIPLLTELAIRKNLVHIDLPRITITDETLSLIKMIRENNPALCWFGDFDLETNKIATKFLNSFDSLTAPITVRCVVPYGKDSFDRYSFFQELANKDRLLKVVEADWDFDSTIWDYA